MAVVLEGIRVLVFDLDGAGALHARAVALTAAVSRRATSEAPRGCARPQEE